MAPVPSSTPGDLVTKNEIPRGKRSKEKTLRKEKQRAGMFPEGNSQEPTGKYEAGISTKRPVVDPGRNKDEAARPWPVSKSWVGSGKLFCAAGGQNVLETGSQRAA